MEAPEAREIQQRKPLTPIKSSWATVKALDRSVHDRFVGSFPRAIPMLDGALEALFGVVSHPAFALIATVVLLLLGITGGIKWIVFWSATFACAVAVLWVARAKPVRALTVMLRFVFIGVIAILSVIITYSFGQWAIRASRTEKAAEQPSERPRPTGETKGVPPETHGTTDGVKPNVEHHGTTDTASAKVGQPKADLGRQLRSRIRITNVLVVPEGTVAFPPGEAPFPAISVYYDVVGEGPVTSVVNRFAAAFATGGQISENDISSYQDNLLHWSGWKDAMAQAAQKEIYAGDPGEFTTIPNSEGPLAEDFRKNWSDVDSGKQTLYILIAFKYRTQTMPAGRNGITETCFWFSGFAFGRHDCGRRRSFLESAN